jgi:hypothetical protein
MIQFGKNTIIDYCASTCLYSLALAWPSLPRVACRDLFCLFKYWEGIEGAVKFMV